VPLRLSIDEHALTLIEADGAHLTHVRVRDLVLQPAQRYSVLVERYPDDKRQEFWIKAQMVEDKFAYDKCVFSFPVARALTYDVDLIVLQPVMQVFVSAILAAICPQLLKTSAVNIVNSEFHAEPLSNTTCPFPRPCPKVAADLGNVETSTKNTMGAAAAANLLFLPRREILAATVARPTGHARRQSPLIDRPV
jgi:FtsP/CotA-like multicopper oxidase with cupredoxin domain